MQTIKSLIKQLLNNEPQKFGTVISFPKSGRTWLRVMLDNLSIGMEYTHAGSKYSLSCHFNELPLPSEVETSGKQILLIRDPIDTAVSGYFQKTKRKKNSEMIDISDFVRDPRYGVEKIAQFNITWLNHIAASDSSTHRAISYEELRSDPVAGLTSIFTFLTGHTPRHPKTIERVVEEASFARMQAKERSGKLAKQYGSALRPGNIKDPESFKVRRGKIGGYADYLSQEDISYCKDVLIELGYAEVLKNCSMALLHRT